MTPEPKFKIGDIVKHVPSGQHLGIVTHYNREKKQYAVGVELMKYYILNEESIELEDRPEYLKSWREE